MYYYALIGDMIDSRQRPDRAAVQERLAYALDQLNTRYAPYLASKFSLTLGDEFQGLLHQGAPVFQLIDDLRLALPDIGLRFGLGVGEIVTQINPQQSLGADGPAYWRARQAIQRIHQHHHYETVHLALITDRSEADLSWNHSLALSEFVRSSWIDSQMDTFRAILALGYYQARFDQKAVAAALDVTSSAFAKRMKSSGIKLYLAVKDDLTRALAQLKPADTEGKGGYDD